jgi:hypothetical protein
MSGSFGQRVLAASIYTWFQETVLPLWKAHAQEILSAPQDLEKDLQEQASKLNYSDDDGHMEPLEGDEHRLFYSAKIAYTALDADLSWDDPPLSENPSQPCFVGTSRMEKLFLYLRGMPLRAAEIRSMETGSAPKRRPYMEMFRNPLETSGGYKYGNTMSCLSLYGQIRMIILEDFRHVDGEVEQTRGGLIFLFFNPRYAERGVRLLQELMEQHQQFTLSTSAFYLIKSFSNLMALFLFPSRSLQVELDVLGRTFYTDFGAFIKLFFSGCDVSPGTLLSEFHERGTDHYMTLACHDLIKTIRKYSISSSSHTLSLHVVTTKIPTLNIDKFEAFFFWEGVRPASMRAETPPEIAIVKRWIKQCESDTTL